ncbi:DNA mismatch repair protein MutS [Paenibacillus alvei]|uniref:endonuclease MutS2 n=1 Tax=Paenibacillus alvei TaxID=44250 RepID=UPI00228252C4|nr:DNA mismatch repair protein MutS [Paenibacillus alvei]MCY9737800.1 DNA mismatch repair protein MutS [Paenibacillus alvei]MCY9756123.1 DNA mismatch repair protein MutS [Paenibacillus alvei]
MNEAMLQRLDYHKVKAKVSEYAVSYAGKSHVEQMSPLTNIEEVRRAMEEVAEASFMLKQGASVPLPTLQGIEHILSLISTGYVFSEEDFANVAVFLRSCAQLKKYMRSKLNIAPTVSQYAASMYELEWVRDEIERCIRHGRIADEASKELGRVRRKMMQVENRIKQRLDSLMNKHRAIMQEHLVGMRGGRYVLPIRKELRKQFHGTVLDESASGQTVYMEPTEIAHLQHQLAQWRTEETREEMKVLSCLTELLEQSTHELEINVDTVGVYDYLFARAKYSRAIDGRSVQLNDRGIIDIRDAKHPLLGGDTVPLTFRIGRSYSCLIITGPNTGGKTVALKTVGLLTLMVQSGLLVPAQENSMFSVFGKVCVDIGDGQSMEQSLSTFSAHVTNVIHILEEADQSTLVLFDEMASGTDPGEGVGLSIAILEELRRRGAIVVATTHFNEIKHFASATNGFENARMEFDADTLQPRYQLRIGEAGSSYAFLIASKLGLAADIITRSQHITQSLGSGTFRAGEEAHALTGESECKPTEPQHDRWFTRDEEGSANEAIRVDETSSVEEMEEGASDAQHAKRLKEQKKSEIPHQRNKKSSSVKLQKGDCVFISYLKRTGIVYEEEDVRGNVGVLIQQQKVKINKKRLTLYIEKQDLYPKDYDMDIVFESKENRKKKKIMSRKHVEGISIEYGAEE